jgi:hypothetical protein
MACASSTAPSSHPVSEPSEKELHTHRAPLGSSRKGAMDMVHCLSLQENSGLVLCCHLQHALCCVLHCAKIRSPGNGMLNICARALSSELNEPDST